MFDCLNTLWGRHIVSFVSSVFFSTPGQYCRMPAPWRGLYLHIALSWTTNRPTRAAKLDWHFRIWQTAFQNRCGSMDQIIPRLLYLTREMMREMLLQRAKIPRQNLGFGIWRKKSLLDLQTRLVINRLLSIWLIQFEHADMELFLLDTRLLTGPLVPPPPFRLSKREFVY